MNLDFDKYKALQFCDNPECTRNGEVGGANIKTMSRKQGRVYCSESGCKNVWPITKDTFFHHMKKPKEKVMDVLLCLSEGMGVRATSRTHNVTTDSIQNWILKSARYMNEISLYLKRDMELSQVQIDEFWSFISKKRESYRGRSPAGGPQKQ